MEKNNISNASNGTKYENQLSVVNADILSALFDLKRIKDIFDEQCFEIRKNDMDVCFLNRQDDFYDLYAGMKDILNKMLIERVEQNIENQN